MAAKLRRVSESVIAPPAPLVPAEGAMSLRATRGDYLEILKPQIMLLIVITTVGAMGFAAHGWPGTWLLVATVIGMCLSSGGSSALNHWYDRDIDLLMTRTASRPVASGRIAARDALVIGNVLGLGGVLWLGIVVNWPAALWALAGFLCYVLVYTVWLKRTTPQNIVIGGAAGAIPPLVGWAAVTGRTDLAAVALFLIIFLWTPPHFWSLAIMLEDDYEAAGIPMLPNVAGREATSRQITLYASLLLASSFIPVVLGDLGVIYAAAAALLGGRFLWLAVDLMHTPDIPTARRTFRFSLLYLAALFVAMALDRALLG
ncbi:MAG: heme o synthase [Gaiellales bacterium]|nr:heme o synthase [Gaiellales bacterium]MDX6566245.1 heme o synthase [Gaiellales bacterium]